MRVVCAVVVAGVLMACGSPEGAGDTAAGAEPAMASARNCNVSISGNLRNERLDKVLREAYSMTPNGSWNKHPSRAMAIQPLCESRNKNAQQLARGAFVARILILEATSPFSRMKTDLVYWWVYQENGVEKSQFVSTTDTVAADAIIDMQFRDCPDESGVDKDSTGWHGAGCHSAAQQMATLQNGGDNPWFACTRGCCYAVGGGPLRPTDSLRDTLPRSR